MAADKEYPLKTRVIRVLDKKTGVYYLEERVTQYDPVKKWNRVVSTRRTGEKLIDGNSAPVPCRPKRKAATPPERVGDVSATRRRVRVEEIFDWVARGSKLDETVRNAFPYGGIADKILSVARYLVATNDTIHNIDVWQYEHDLPYKEGISEDMCYDLFDDLGRDEAGMQNLFRALSSIGGEKQTILAFDSTTISSYATSDIAAMARYGHSKEKDGLPAFKLLTFYSLTSRLPVSFELQPGNIPDVSSLLNGLKRVKSYGLNQPEVVLDNGFFSRENTCRFCREHIKFTMRATLSDKWIHQHPDTIVSDGQTVRQCLDHMAATCPFDAGTVGYTVSEMTSFTWTRQRARLASQKKAGDTEEAKYRIYYHFFRNNSKAATQVDSLRERLNDLKNRVEAGCDNFTSEEGHLIKKCLVISNKGKTKKSVTYNEKGFAEEIKDCGIFVLISNVHKDRWTALKHYRQRNIIEQSYHTIKADLDGRRARVWSSRRERGKELCRLVALGYLFYLQDALCKIRQNAEALENDASLTKIKRDSYKSARQWLSNITLTQFLGWFDCIENVRVENSRGNHRWTTENTSRDKLVLDLLREALTAE